MAQFKARTWLWPSLVVQGSVERVLFGVVGLGFRVYDAGLRVWERVFLFDTMYLSTSFKQSAPPENVK